MTFLMTSYKGILPTCDSFHPRKKRKAQLPISQRHERDPFLIRARRARDGALGGFVTGSGTSANVLFGSL